jgi:hypothetical protein
VVKVSLNVNNQGVGNWHSVKPAVRKDMESVEKEMDTVKYPTFDFSDGVKLNSAKSTSSEASFVDKVEKAMQSFQRTVNSFLKPLSHEKVYETDSPSEVTGKAWSNGVKDATGASIGAGLFWGLVLTPPIGIAVGLGAGVVMGLMGAYKTYTQDLLPNPDVKNQELTNPEIKDQSSASNSELQQSQQNASQSKGSNDVADKLNRAGDDFLRTYKKDPQKAINDIAASLSREDLNLSPERQDSVGKIKEALKGVDVNSLLALSKSMDGEMVGNALRKFSNEQEKILEKHPERRTTAEDRLRIITPDYHTPRKPQKIDPNFKPVDLSPGTKFKVPEAVVMKLDGKDMRVNNGKLFAVVQNRLGIPTEKIQEILVNRTDKGPVMDSGMNSFKTTFSVKTDQGIYTWETRTPTINEAKAFEESLVKMNDVKAPGVFENKVDQADLSKLIFTENKKDQDEYLKISTLAAFKSNFSEQEWSGIESINISRSISDPWGNDMKSHVVSFSVLDKEGNKQEWEGKTLHIDESTALVECARNINKKE